MFISVPSKLLLVFVLLSQAVLLNHPMQSMAQTPPANPKLLIASELDAANLAMLTPFAALCFEKSDPALLAVDSPESRQGVEQLINTVGTDKTLWITTTAQTPDSAERLVLPSDHLETGMVLAQRYWQKPSEVVLVAKDDMEGLIFAGALAGHLRLPLLVIDDQKNAGDLNQVLNVLGVRHVKIVCSENQPTPDWQDALNCPVQILRGQQAETALIQTIGPAAIRNVIVIRGPDATSTSGDACFLAPYLSIARKSAIVISPSRDVQTVETSVNAMIQRNDLHPRTLTILADDDGIAEQTILLTEDEISLEVAVEPCAAPGLNPVVGLGVGRIPYADSARGSILIARGLVHEQMASVHSDGLLMIANPNPEYGALPLAETVARLTAEDFENCKVPVNAFFGVTPDEQVVREKAAKAQLIIYQGHITDHRLFSSGSQWEEEGYSDEYDSGDELQDSSTQYDDGESTDDSTSENQFPVDNSSVFNLDPTDNKPVILPAAIRFDTDLIQTNEADRSDIQLGSHALVVLQSCSSLHDDATQSALNSGASGVIGSVTSIHSASGSSFVKAWSDAVLYRDARAGEALRDAKNYFLLLVELKRARGHTQQAKTLRVGLSFRLWGDPEMKLFPGQTAPLHHKPVKGEMVGNSVIMEMPKRTFKQIQTDRYVVRAFAGSETAGIVKRIKDKEYRRLMPLYFLRLPIPTNKTFDWQRNVTNEIQSNPRTVYSMDPFGQFVNVLHFPEQTTRNETIQLPLEPMTQPSRY